MSNADDPAYPPTEAPWRAWANPGVNDETRECLGMTKRELIAMHALAGILTGTRGSPSDMQLAARRAVLHADALLAELERTEKP